MADPLSLLRQYNIDAQEIIERDNQIIFGETSFSKDVVTTWLKTDKKSIDKEYYTLECLLYFVKNHALPHVAYFNKAAAANMPAVRRPDRKKLLQYLFGEAIDNNASKEHKEGKEPPVQNKRTHNEKDSESETKKPRVEETHGKKHKQKKKKNKKNKSKIHFE